MTFLDRTRDARAFRHWSGHVEADYVYTSGLAGETFFRELRENGRILGTRCGECGTQWLPPKLFCERCFKETKDWVEVSGPGRVEAVTLVSVGPDGARLREPEAWALIRFRGFEGGFVHRLLVDAKHARTGLSVRPVVKDRSSRVGAITDIEGFSPSRSSQP